MKKILTLVVCATMMLMLNGCSSDESSKDFHVRNCSNTGCKDRYMTRGDSTPYGDDMILPTTEGNIEYIAYVALSGGYLSLNHVNSIFNCAVGQLNIQAVIDGNVIKVLEKANEPEYLANCVCPFDLYCEIGPLADGNYKIYIYKGSFDGNDYTNFSITYTSGLSGVHKPWND